MPKKTLEEAIQHLDDWSESQFKELEAAVNSYVEEAVSCIDEFRERSITKIRSSQEGTDKVLEQTIARLQRISEAVNRKVEPREKWFKCEIDKLERVEKGSKPPLEAPVSPPETEVVETPTRVLQALSYTVFDTILFSITRGSAPDFTLLSQSALFETVYVNISRGFESYLFHDVPESAVAVIHQGRAILEELREREERFLDEGDLWDTYAPDIQNWWVNTALPIIFGERDPDWDNQVFPTHDEMKLWSDGEYSQRKHFPAVSDLVDIAKEHAVAISEKYDFRLLLNA